MFNMISSYFTDRHTSESLGMPKLHKGPAPCVIPRGPWSVST